MLSGVGFSSSLVRQLLFAVHQVTKNEQTRDGLNWLKTELIADYWNNRDKILNLNIYLTFNDLGTTFISKLFFDLKKFSLNLVENVGDHETLETGECVEGYGPDQVGRQLLDVHAAMMSECQRGCAKTRIVRDGDVNLVFGRNQTLECHAFCLGRGVAMLVANKGRAFTRDQILERVWGYDYIGETRTVDVHVSWLREKLEEDPGMAHSIITIRGVGYRFDG